MNIGLFVPTDATASLGIGLDVLYLIFLGGFGKGESGLG